MKKFVLILSLFLVSCAKSNDPKTNTEANAQTQFSQQNMSNKTYCHEKVNLEYGIFVYPSCILAIAEPKFKTESMLGHCKTVIDQFLVKYPGINCVTPDTSIYSAHDVTEEKLKALRQKADEMSKEVKPDGSTEI